MKNKHWWAIIYKKNGEISGIHCNFAHIFVTRKEARSMMKNGYISYKYYKIVKLVQESAK
jgi:Na+/H+ antiporter NhaB